MTKTEKSIEEMVRELDEKFEGAITHLMLNMLNRVELECDDYPAKVVSKAKFSAKQFSFLFEIDIEEGYQKSFYLEFTNITSVVASYNETSLSECITKAHKYFIQDGNEL